MSFFVSNYDSPVTYTCMGCGLILEGTAKKFYEDQKNHKCDPKEKIAYSLSNLLKELAEACLEAADGDKEAIKFLQSHTDHYWNGLVVGIYDIRVLTDPEEEENES